MGISDLGHAIEQPIPSLFTFNIADKAFKNLMGTVVDPVYTLSLIHIFSAPTSRTLPTCLAMNERLAKYC